MRRSVPFAGLWVLSCFVLTCLFASLPGLGQGVPPGQGQVADSTELRVLRQLYTATEGDHWRNHSAWLTGTTLADADAWYGVEVVAGDVYGLYFVDNGLKGELPVSLGELRSLVYLNVQQNQLSGPLPAGLGQLAQLQQLSVGHNQLSGSLPAGLGQLAHLRTLSVSVNQFSGALPMPAAGAWRQLAYLDASYNQLSGALTDSLGNCPLGWLDVSHNQFSGPLPAGLARCTSLRWLYVQNNRFSGALPAAWGRLPLYYLIAADNQLSGTIPAAWSRFSQLGELNLTRNQLTGLVPDSLRVPYLLLSDNQLDSLAPGYATHAWNLQLILDHNRLHSLPDFTQRPNLNAVQVSANGNYLDFADLERNWLPAYRGTANPGWAFGCGGQRTTPADSLLLVAGQGAGLDGQVGGAHNRYQWQRLVSGQWVNVPGQTQVELRLADVTAAETGTYRAQVTNDWVAGGVLYSPPRYVDVVPYAPLARNWPDDTNQGTGIILAARLTLVEDAARTGDVNYVRSWVPRVALTDAQRVGRAPVDSVAVSTTYLDGLGRPLQTVQHQASPGRRDLVQPHAYDELGRERYQFLPYVADPTAQRQGYHPGAVAAQDAFYRRTEPEGGIGPLAPNDPIAGVARSGAAYAETLFEASPLSRVAAQGAAGEAWQLTAGHVVEHAERPNTDLDSIPRLVPGYGSGPLDLTYQGYYAAGELWGAQVADAHGPKESGEQGYRTIEWKDKLGQVVCRQVEASRVRHPQDVAQYSRWLRTCYAYDDFQHLRYVVQPEGSKQVLALGSQVGRVPASMAPYLFHYRYDKRGRQIAKQVPGQDGETVVVYDQLDRPVLSQDAQQRTRREWSWTKYDVLGRVVLTGLMSQTDTVGQVRMQAWADADTLAAHQYELRTTSLSGDSEGYSTANSFPRAGQQGFIRKQVLTVTYYDDYDFDNDGQADVQYDASLDARLGGGLAPVADAQRTTGLVTRTRTRVLGVTETDPQQAAWLQTTTFYDERARPIQVQTSSARREPLTGQPYRDVVTTQLDFTGKVLRSVAAHQGPNHAPLLVREQFRYDHAGRATSTRQQLPGETRAAVVDSVQYNELGQVTRRVLGEGRLRQNVDYAYNMRGWLLRINDPYQAPAAFSAVSVDYVTPPDLFALSLHYERGFTKGYEQYNGNLTGQTWRGRDGVQRAYGYVYDPLNRLLQGDYVARAGGAAGASTSGLPWNQEQDNYRLSFVSYDDNGNLLTLHRRGLLQAATRRQGRQYGPVDNLTYTYAPSEGNRLHGVQDAIKGNRLARPATYHGAPISLAGDFQELRDAPGQDYAYDANGNLTSDANKGITAIAYTHLNLPRQIHFGQMGDSITFRYTAAGQKVAKLVYQSGRPVQRTDYLGPYQYEGDSLRFFPHAQGRVLRFVSYDAAQQAHVSYQREFTIKDHLGNLRLAYRAGQARTYLATLEQDSTTRQRETHQFDSLSVSPPVAVATPYSNGAGHYAARLNAGGNAPQPLGPLTQLAVQRGDKLKVEAPGYYPQRVTNSGFVFSLLSFVTNLLQPSQGNAPVPPDASRRRALPLLQVGLSAGLTAIPQVSGGVPKGYLRVLFFNQDSVLLTQQTVTRQLSQAANTGYEVLQTDTLTVAQDGYVTVYVGNESPADVYFDDIRITHRPGLQVQETQYDPAGLELAGLAPASPGLRGLNNYRFNGKEFQADLGLSWNHQDWRFFDPQLLRWHAVDPEIENGQESWTPYAFGYDNAVRYADADGREPAGSDPPTKPQPFRFNYIYRNANGIHVYRGTVSNGMFNYSLSHIRGSAKNLTNVSDKSAGVIATSMARANIGSVYVTSTHRTPRQDAAAMYDNAIKPNGVAKGYHLYGSNGDKVVDTYVSARAAGLNRGQTIDRMTAKIMQLGPTNVSHHAFDPTVLSVIDMSSKMLGVRGLDFNGALLKNSEIHPMFSPYTKGHRDPAFHVEISPSAPSSSTPTPMH